ncbi:MAG: hypothetical protein WCD89_08720 [Anaerocolumna sp.]
MAKKNSKSIRLSNKVMGYIESYNGNGFNEKFENIILFAMETEKERISWIGHLDEQIKNKQIQLSDYETKFYKMQGVNRTITDILSKMQLLDKQENEL